MKSTELEQFGFTNKEADVYLAALELGAASAQKIAQKSKLKRPTTYVVIDALTKKGLMSSFHQGKKQLFVAENPERLTKYLENKKREIEEQKITLNALLPELKGIFNRVTEKPAVRFYEGKQGLLTMSEEFLESNEKEAYMVYPYDLVEKIFKENERGSAREKRKQKNMRVKSIYTSAEKKLSDTEWSTREKVPGETFPLTCDIAIFKNKVRIASLEEPLSGLIIEDKNIAATLRSLFKLAWEAAKKYNQE